MRRVLPTFLATLALAGASAVVHGRVAHARGGDCNPHVDAAAERVFGQFQRAFRGEDAAAVVALMAPREDARLTLRLSGVKAGAYPAGQAREVLKRSYFDTRDVLSVVEGEGCTRGTETRLVRSYRLRLRAQGTEQERTLTAVIVRSGQSWHLDSVSDS